MQSISWEMLGWMKHKLESRWLGKYQSPQIRRWCHPFARNWRGTKELLDEEESEKAGLKLSIQKTKIMASSPITSWQIDGETVETVRDFIFLGSKITADGDSSHEMKRHLLLGRKALKKQRHYFTNKGPSSQSYSFSSSHVRMWELDHKESWAPKNWCF